ncbi:TetR/AcrR family transcriptional regulator [Nocardia sp. CDC159]|uniref:TetR/AcrR family transcriptional regulator n=1 Tax=Nocardia pulmonis TaxID=2951408 RepID=A0A9X2IX19_9NOCA|nr:MULTISPECIES: TetR/AcrR family transcriptional regulator [Nocardia]MCM6772451.1 TetR/AcrR family transcriptional regulator [Nocardia pulmonis]MCM6784891.1 TetR/AcrR family transcriptional regulator [Nocardia sp. CDC159]
MPQRQRLSAADWTSAALEALADGGLAAVAVEPIAARLGTTKGSFYWHFPGRDALVTAALELWERVDTEEVIAEIDAQPPGLPRLRALIVGAVEGRTGDAARAELALLATARHPLVAPVLARVTRRRLDYLAEQFAELGFPPEEAARRAQLAYTSYLGIAQLAHATPDEADLSPAYLDTMLRTLTASP